jgi:hypothetical protein
MVVSDRGERGEAQRELAALTARFSECFQMSSARRML